MVYNEVKKMAEPAFLIVLKLVKIAKKTLFGTKMFRQLVGSLVGRFCGVFRLVFGALLGGRN